MKETPERETLFFSLFLYPSALKVAQSTPSHVSSRPRVGEAHALVPPSSTLGLCRA